MMARFGSWSEYRAAPRHVVDEQICAWQGYAKAEAEINAEASK